MRQAWYITITAVLLAFTSACEESTPPPIDPVVVDGVLIQGQPIVNVKLWKLSELGAPANQPFEDIDAIVIRDDTGDFFLSPQSGVPGSYYDASGQLSLVPGKFYQLIIARGEDLTYGATQVPFPPQGLNPSQSQYALNAEDRQGNGFFQFTWINPNGLWFVGKLIRITPDNPIDPNENAPTIPELLTGIVNNNVVQIPFANVNHYGTYAFILYAVNPEYLTYFGQTNPDVRLQQYTNIFNGLGIFTAVTPDTTYFQVIPR